MATITINEGPSEIRRIDQQRAALLTANVSGRDLASVTQDIEDMEEKADTVQKIETESEKVEML